MHDRTLALSLVLFAACGSGGSGGEDITLIDARTVGTDSDTTGTDGSGACTAATSYTAALTDANSGAETSGSGFDDAALENGTAHVIQGGGGLDTSAAPDYLTIELWAGYGAFTGADISATTVTISGDETDYYTCGACLVLYTDLTDDGSGGVNFAHTYMAQSGQLTLTSVSGTLSGSLTNVALANATFDDTNYVTTPVGDCNTTISGTFSMPIEQASNAFRAGEKAGKPLRLQLRRTR
jgi:hypothetical protein